MSTYLAETVETEYVQGALARYGYREYGKEGGIPLLLLTRYKGTLDDWDPLLLDLLAAERRIITLDNIGVGYTDGIAPSTIAGMADGVLDFLDAREISCVDLLGWSMGGMVAQYLAVEHADRLASVTIAGSGPGEPSVRPEEDPRSVEIRGKIDPTIDDILFLFFPDDDAGRAAGGEVLGRGYHRADGNTAVVKEESWRNQDAAIQKWNGGESTWSRLSQITVPALVANGTEDVMEPAAQTVAMADRLRDGLIALFSESGHAFLFQHAERFSRLLLGFTARS